MTDKINGGPAFPHPNPGYAQNWGRTDRTPPFGGMSLRDYFAAQALVGSLASVSEDDVRDMTKAGMTATQRAHLFAEHAFIMADAMLTERDK